MGLGRFAFVIYIVAVAFCIVGLTTYAWLTVTGACACNNICIKSGIGTSNYQVCTVSVSCIISCDNCKQICGTASLGRDSYKNAGTAATALSISGIILLGIIILLGLLTCCGSRHGGAAGRFYFHIALLAGVLITLAAIVYVAITNNDSTSDYFKLDYSWILTLVAGILTILTSILERFYFQSGGGDNSRYQKF